MLDEDEVREYEDWKERKLKGSTDLSVTAFNTEQEAAALHWEHGFKASVNGQTIESNPYRKPGMSGHRDTPVSETSRRTSVGQPVFLPNGKPAVVLQNFNDAAPNSISPAKVASFEKMIHDQTRP